MTALRQLKRMIDEANFPYFDDEDLQARIDELEDESELAPLARELCLEKASIEDIKLGDITIPSPKKHFLRLAQKYRTNQSRVAVRADEY